MDVTITPNAEASMILSSIATSKLKLPRSVALTGELLDYWEFKHFYGFLGLQNSCLISSILSSLEDQAVAIAMSRASTLDRVSSAVSSDPVEIVRMSDPIISKDSALAESPNDAEAERLSLEPDA